MPSTANALRKRSPGRPSKLTPETQGRILSAVRCGASFKNACVAAGISERTFQRWRQKGERQGAKTEYRRVWRERTRAEQEGQTARLAIVQKAALHDWRAATWLLERMDPERFSLRYKIEHSGQVGNSVAESIRADLDRLMTEHPELARKLEDEALGMSMPPE